MTRKTKVVIFLIILAVIAYFGISAAIISARDYEEAVYKHDFISAFGRFPPESREEMIAMSSAITAKLENIKDCAQNADPGFPRDYCAELAPKAKQSVIHYANRYDVRIRFPH